MEARQMKSSNCNHATCDGKNCRRAIQAKSNRTPIKKVSDKRKLENSVYNREIVKFKAGNPACQVPDCNRMTSDVHHMKGRDGDRLTDSKYFMAVCRPCHTAIHDGKLKGFIISKFNNETNG